MNIDRLSPATIGEDKIVCKLDSASLVLVGYTVQVSFDYSKCLPEGASLPLEVIVQGPTEASYLAKMYRSLRPVQFSFIPSEVGEHLVLIREVAHNRWTGQLRIVVAGDTDASSG